MHGLQDIEVVLRSSMMRWYGHVERIKGFISQVRKLNEVAQNRSGKLRKSWNEVLLKDEKKARMDTADPYNRSEWRGCLRLKTKLRSFEYICEKGDGPYRSFGYPSLFNDP